jgi:hypothetical protein
LEVQWGRGKATGVCSKPVCAVTQNDRSVHHMLKMAAATAEILAGYLHGFLTFSLELRDQFL